MRNALFAVVAAVQVAGLAAVLYAFGPGRRPNPTAEVAPVPALDVRPATIEQATVFHAPAVIDVEPVAGTGPGPQPAGAPQTASVRLAADTPGPATRAGPATLPSVAGTGPTLVVDRPVDAATATLVPSADGKLRLAILPMELGDGIGGADGATLAESLQGQFKNPSYDLIERMQLLSLIKEKHFEVTGLFDSRDAVGTVGKLASADCLLLGRMRKLQVTFQISAEIVDLSSKVKEHGVVFFRHLDDAPRQLADLAQQLGGSGERRPPTDYLGDAIKADDIDAFRDLVASSAIDLNALPDGRCPLYEAVVTGRSAMAVLLVENGAKTGGVRDGKTLLYLAAEHDLPDVIRAMVRKGMPVDVPNPVTGRTPLWGAVYHRQSTAVEALLGLGANLDQPNKTRVTPRQLAEREAFDVNQAAARPAAGPAK